MTPKICLVDSCGPIQGKCVRGYCGKHYQRKRKWGDPLYKAPNFGGQSGDIDLRTGLLVRVRDQIEVTEDCWIWKGCVNSDGYGSLRHLGVWWSVHRYVYTTLIGDIAPGLELDHTCTVRNCCNPSHLEPVTPRENKRRVGERRDFCTKGLHERTPENIRVVDGSTRCRPCQNEYQREYSRNRRLENHR